MTLDPKMIAFCATVIFCAGGCWRELRACNRGLAEMARQVHDIQRFIWSTFGRENVLQIPPSEK